MLNDEKKTLHHYGLTAAQLEPVCHWYATVLGMSVVVASSSPLGKKAPIKVSAVWITNDGAHHRIGLIAIPQLRKRQATKHSHSPAS
jgi:hypothetical protein